MITALAILVGINVTVWLLTLSAIGRLTERLEVLLTITMVADDCEDIANRLKILERPKTEEWFRQEGDGDGDDRS